MSSPSQTKIIAANVQDLNVFEMCLAWKNGLIYEFLLNFFSYLWKWQKQLNSESSTSFSDLICKNRNWNSNISKNYNWIENLKVSIEIPRIIMEIFPMSFEHFYMKFSI